MADAVVPGSSVEGTSTAASYAAKFTSTRSVLRLMDLPTRAAARLGRSQPLKSPSLEGYLAAWPRR